MLWDLWNLRLVHTLASFPLLPILQAIQNWMAGRPGNEAGSTLCDYKLTNIYILQSKDFPGWSLASQDDKIWLGFLVGSRASLWDIKIMPQALTVANTTATMPFFFFFWSKAQCSIQSPPPTSSHPRWGWQSPSDHEALYWPAKVLPSSPLFLAPGVGHSSRWEPKV